MKLVWLCAAVPACALVISEGTPIFGRHADALQKAQTLVVKFKVTEVGGQSEEQSLSLSRPGRLKWESAKLVVISDGKTATVYDKASNTYTQAAATGDWLRETLMPEPVWAWSAFFDAKAAKIVGGEKAGPTRIAAGAEVMELALDRGERPPITLLIDKKSGIARGETYKTGQGNDVIVQATKFEVGEEALPAELFSWTPPGGAKLATAETTAKLRFSDVMPIFERQCSPCHTSDRPKGDLKLTSYDSIRGENVVTPGDPDSSRLITMIKTGKMPPGGGGIPAEDIKKLRQWIKDGAQQ